MHINVKLKPYHYGEAPKQEEESIIIIDQLKMNFT